MIFWLCIFLISVGIPVAMIVFGILFIRAAFIGFISSVGYRSRRSRRSSDEWAFANKMVGRHLIIFGSILLPIYLFIMLLLFTATESVVGLYGGIMILFSIIPVVLSFLPVERKLKKNFNFYGQRRKKENVKNLEE